MDEPPLRFCLAHHLSLKSLTTPLEKDSSILCILYEEIMKKGDLLPKRPSFPDEERAIPWLSMLIDAHYIVDKGIKSAIDSEIRKGRRLACKEGCSNCCKTHKDIPVYPLEIMGIAWYAKNKVNGREKDILMVQLRQTSRYKACPFLVEDRCSIHIIRPMACRQFNVFGRPCDEGEDPFYTRPQDLLPPVTRHVEQAFFIMLPFHGVEKESERIKVIEQRIIHRMVKNLKECNWRLLLT